MATSSSAAALPAGIKAYVPMATQVMSKNSLGTSAAETQDNFMKMLLAQIQNQDPLSPQDPSQMTSQLTQLNMAGGIEKLNTSISSMLNQVSAQSFLNDSSLIGYSVLAPGSMLSLATVGSTDFGIQMSADSTKTTVSVMSADGKVVDEMSLGPLAQGLHKFAWDGVGSDGNRLEVGAYRLVVNGVDVGGAPVGSSLLTAGVVEGVGRGGTGSQLLMADGRTINLADVAQLTKP